MSSTRNDPHPSETTGLLFLPSRHSTNDSVGRNYSAGSLPLASSYEDLHGTLEYQLQQVLHRTSSGKDLKSSNRSPDVNVPTMQRQKSIFILIFACGISVAMISYLDFHGLIRENPVSPSTLVYGSFGVEPFSEKHPVHDLGLMDHHRPQASSPPDGLFRQLSSKTDANQVALPTNAWYQNMLLLHGEPANVHRAYSLPYLVDCVGLIPGLQIHNNFLVSSTYVVQLSLFEAFGLTLGATKEDISFDMKETRRYSVGETTELGVTLHWDELKMYSPIVRGMAYSSMIYERTDVASSKRTHSSVRPTIASAISFGTPPIADGSTEIDCSHGTKVLVEQELELYFGESDSTWLVFISEPAWFQCQMHGNHAFLQVVDYENEKSEIPFVIRAALLDSCTTGKNPNRCNKQHEMPSSYREILRTHKNAYPGPNTSVKYEIQDNEAKLILDWDVQRMSNHNYTQIGDTLQGSLRQDGSPAESSDAGLIAFALPHHLDRLDDYSAVLKDNEEHFCKTTMSGSACLVEGNELVIMESLPTIGLRAPRPPHPSIVPLIVDALEEDINYELPSFFQRGAGDTYFSGKMLSKLARILVISEEVFDLCQNDKDYDRYCYNVTSSLKEGMSAALDRLQDGVEIWIKNGAAETPFVYDSSWGGLASCGCLFNGDGCDNKAPNCPAFSDQGLNFGNAFYNDQHFHYGYHIYAAAVVAHFRPVWGKAFYEEVLLLVRSIANPSRNDNAFPLFRHKDWYKGSSWASGIPLPPYLNGKNQESSSEAIAAYESVALYGQIMTKIWSGEGEKSKATTCKGIEKIGQLLAATEVRSAKKYWHVLRSSKDKIYPEPYAGNVVGIVWSTMIQFGTWFGSAKYLPYGIQLLPLTPISEERDDLEWANEMYYPFSEACAESFQCTEGGWVVLQLAILATVGYKEEAAKRMKELPDEAFTNAGGNGHSRTNTLWYLGTRPSVSNPVPIAASDVRGQAEHRPAPVFELKDCHVPETCTEQVLDRMAGSFSCRDRISWQIRDQGKPQWEACSTVAGLEYPKICGPCEPGNTNVSEHRPAPVFELKDCYVPETCTEQVLDRMAGSFSCRDRISWLIRDQGKPQWEACSSIAGLEYPKICGPCEPGNTNVSTTENDTVDKEELRENGDKDNEKEECPPCTQEECNSKLNRCPVFDRTFVCTKGASTGGCSGEAWPTVTCSKCCEMTACQDLRDKEAKKITHDADPLKEPVCPPCPNSICYGKLNQCPLHQAPYVCIEGDSYGGCSSRPWDISPGSACSECCEITTNC